MKNYKKYFGLLIILLLSYFALKPLFVSGFFTMHDDTQVARVYEMGKALEDGMFPVRWAFDLGYGYGYPIFNFYAPLAYYFGGLFTLVGFDALIATKLMMGLGILLSGIFMYLLAKEFFGDLGGILSALLYVYAPYHAVDIYIRGDVSEFFAYAFIPLVFFALHKVYKEQKWKWVVVGSLAYAGVILSHNLTAMMITPFLIITSLLYCFVAYKTRKLHTIYYILYTIFLGLLLSAFYWIPALLEMQYTNVMSQIGKGADFRDHFICLSQLWNSPWGFGGSVPGCIDGMSFKIGKLHIILSTIALVVFIFYFLANKMKHYYSEKFIFISLSIVGFLLSIFLMLDISKDVWEAIPTMAFLQYPWRFLILASFFSSLITGFSIWLLQNMMFLFKYRTYVSYLTAAVFIFLLIFFNAKIFQPQSTLPRDVKDYTSESELQWRVSKISDEYMPKDFQKPKEGEIIKSKAFFNSDVKIKSSIVNTQNIVFDLSVLKTTQAYINIAYFPSWKVFIDGKVQEPKRLKRGYEVLLLKEHRLLSIQFIETPVEKLSNIISIIGLSVLILGIIKSKLLLKHE